MTTKAKNLRADLVLILKISRLQLLSKSDIALTQLGFNSDFNLYETRHKKFFF